MTNEEILAKVPKGCNGVGKIEGESEWVPMHNSMGIVRSVDDVRRIVELKKANSKLNQEIAELEGMLSRSTEQILSAKKNADNFWNKATQATKRAETTEKRLAEVERERDDYKRIAIDAATESFLIAADNEIKRALAQDNKSASAINHCQQQFHRAARSCAIDCVNNQLRKQLNGSE